MYYKAAGGDTFIDGLMEEVRALPRLTLEHMSGQIRKENQMPAELKDFVVNLKSLSQDIEDPIIQVGGDANGRTFRIIFTQEAADMFTPYTKVYLYWNHQQLKTYGVNVFTKVSKDENCFNPPVWEIHWPKAMLHEGDLLLITSQFMFFKTRTMEVLLLQGMITRFLINVLLK